MGKPVVQLGPIAGEYWSRKRDQQLVVIDKEAKGIVYFTTSPMLVTYERDLDQFIRNYRRAMGWLTYDEAKRQAKQAEQDSAEFLHPNAGINAQRFKDGSYVLTWPDRKITGRYGEVDTNPVTRTEVRNVTSQARKDERKAKERGEDFFYERSKRE